MIWKQFKDARNKASNSVKKAKRKHFSENLESNKSDSRKTWRLINELQSRQSKSNKVSQVKTDTNKASLRRFSSHRQDSSNNLCQRRAISPVSLEIEPVVQLERQELKLDFTAKWSTMKKLRWKLSRNRWFPRQITIHYQGLRNRKWNCLTKHVKLNLLIMCISISHIQECCE